MNMFEFNTHVREHEQVLKIFNTNAHFSQSIENAQTRTRFSNAEHEWTRTLILKPEP